ncbi:hypothetical protein FGG08_005848 [Glutinoglossum americanum]|uniref:Polynucleotide 5'-hydroxyl-kinase GRC3 n=1 Tax=Glutinoglossum americanum TaxID=1670608 RepID=A0A9P8L109_9PEZI|nr:hypothetical protein FGG08_005848 [Glutinoglossum americanum]
MTKKRGRSHLEEDETSPLSAIATRKLARIKMQQNKDRESRNTHEALPPEPNKQRTTKRGVREETREQPNTRELLNKVKLISQNGEELILQTRPGSRLVILGEFSILVNSGEFSIMGARLRGGPQIHVVSAPLCHSLPVIECLSSAPLDLAEIKIQHYNSGIRSLHRVVPLFKHIWGGDPQIPLDKRPSFTTVHSTKSIPKYWKHEAKTLNLPEPWRQLISTLTGLCGKVAPPIIVAAGPKSAGKSVFCRHLYNSMLTNSTSEASNGLAFLDLDPGQPEFSPPGQVSLFHLRSPLFGTHFSRTYCSLTDGGHLVRSHYIGFSTPESDPDHFISCAVDLFTHYRKLLPACALVINTVGWVKALGLEILSNILRQSSASHLVWLTSEDLSTEEDHNLLWKSLEGVSVHKIPLQPTKHTSRTPADLRAMQILSYLHLSSRKKADTSRGSHGLLWDATPLTKQPPWVVGYSGPTPGIVGIAVLGEVLPIEMLATAINGTVVAIVVVEDDDALPEADADQKANDKTNIGKGEGPRGLGIHRDPVTNLPYIPTPNGAPLDPAKTFCAGLALIRGIDTANQSVHLVTPINVSSLPLGKPIVLARGRTELPVWAYIEGGKEASMPYLSFEKTAHMNLEVRTKPSDKDRGRA